MVIEGRRAEAASDVRVRARRSQRRRRAAAFAAGLLLGAAVATTACSGEDTPSPGAADGGADASHADAVADGLPPPDRDAGVDAPSDVAADVPRAPGPDGAALTGPWLAFVSTRLGSFDIFVVRPDGTELHALAQGPGDQLFPAWSPDGKTLAYTSNTAGGAYVLSIVDAASGVTTPLATGGQPGTAPAFSPDGKTVAFGGEAPGGDLIFTVPAAGGKAVAITSGAARDALPVWAPDGSVIYFASDRAGPWEVWSVKPDGTALTRVTTGASLLGGPAISPDGKVIAYTVSTPAAGDAGAGSKVVLYTLATKSAVTFSSQLDSEPWFAGSGTLLGVTSRRYAPGNPEVVLLDTAGAAAPVRLTDSPGVDTQVRFRPSP